MMSVIRVRSTLREAERERTAADGKPGVTIDRVIPYWNETILPRMKSVSA